MTVTSHTTLCKHCEEEIARGKTYVEGEGPTQGYMLLGEVPGKEEDSKGRPFVGRSGGYLFEMLREIGIERRELYISNAVKTRPDNNSTPKMSELRICRDGCLMPEIRRVKPVAIICLGLSPWKSLTDDGQASLIKNRRRVGNLVSDTGADIPFVCTWHPAAILRNKFYEEYFMADLESYLIYNEWDRKPFEVDYEVV